MGAALPLEGTPPADDPEVTAANREATEWEEQTALLRGNYESAQSRFIKPALLPHHEGGARRDRPKHETRKT